MDYNNGDDPALEHAWRTAVRALVTLPEDTND